MTFRAIPKTATCRLMAAAVACGSLALSTLSGCIFAPVDYEFPVCGDGVVHELESCDDGAASTYAWSLEEHCNGGCNGPGPYCGDGVLDEPHEICDAADQNTDAYEATSNCNSDCSGPPPRCGDGSIDAGHEDCEVDADCGENMRCASCQCEVRYCQASLSPIIRASFTLGAGSVGSDATASGDTLYVAAGNIGSQTYDISDREAPQSIASYPTSAFSSAIVVDGAVFYAAQQGLDVFDCSSASGSPPVGNLGTSNSVGLNVVGDWAFLVSLSTDPLYGGVWVADVSVPSAPVRLGSLIVRWLRDVRYRAPYAFVLTNEGPLEAAFTGMKVLDVSDPAAMQELATVITPGDSRSLVLRGDYAYVADGVDHGLTIIDISVPSAPAVVGNVPGFTGNGVEVLGKYAYLAAADGLYVADISDPTNPLQVASLPLQFAFGLAVKDNYAYVIGRIGSVGHAWVVRLCILPP